MNLNNQSSRPKLWEKIAELYSFQIKMCFVSSQTWSMSCCSIQSHYQNESTSQLTQSLCSKQTMCVYDCHSQILHQKNANDPSIIKAHRQGSIHWSFTFFGARHDLKDKKKQNWQRINVF